VTLWKKSALIAMVWVAGLLLVLTAAQRLVVLRSFIDLEREDTQRHTERALLTIRNEIKHLDILAHDWAAWDDMYQFAQDGNEQFRASTLPDEALAANRTNLLMVLDSSGQVVFSRALDLNSGASLEAPELGQERLVSGHPLLALSAVDSSVAGIMLLSQGPMLVVSRPIVTSEEQGPIQGTLLMGRLMDASFVQQLAETAGEKMAVYRLDAPVLPADVALARTALGESDTTYARPLDAQTVAGYALVKDLFGTRVLLVRVEQPRRIYQHGAQSFQVLMLAVAGATLFLAVFAMALWYRTVFSRIERLSAEVNEVGQAADASRRITTSGQDEVGALAGRINAMLAGLERAQQARKRNQGYMQALAEAAQVLLAQESEIPYEPFLRLLGEAAGASRVYVYLLMRREGEELYVDEAAEWHANGRPFEAGSPRFQDFAVRAHGFERWLETLAGGQSINGPVADFPAAERAVLEAEGISAVLALPLNVDGVLEGFIGFDQRGTIDPWDPELVDLLRAAAADLSQALKRQRAEAELEQLKEFNEGIVRGMEDGLILEDASGTITFVNPALERLVGYTSAELLGRHWSLIVAPQEVERVQSQTQQRPGGTCGRYEARLRHKDGHEIPVLVSARPMFQEGKFCGVLTAFADITARVQAEAQTQAWKQRYDLTVASSGQIVYDYDTADGSIVWGGGIERVLGLTPAEMSGGLRRWEEMLHPEDRPRATALLSEAEKLAAPYDVQYRMRHKDGSYRWLHDRGFFVTQAEGRPPHMLGMLQDITARKRAEEERDKLEMQLREAQKMQSIGMLAGGVAHDFNNMLTVILGNTELALTRAEPASTLQRELEAVQKTAKRAAALTQQLLAFSRRQILQPRPVDLNALVSDLAHMLGRLIGEHIQLQLELAPKLGEVYADPAALTQALMNLTLNARDAMPPDKGGGELRIATHAVMPDAAFYEAHPEAKRGAYAKLSVIDNGEGMDATTMQHLFEPFFTTKELGKGSGLGLAVVYGIVRQHNGWINVHSQPGRGTRFDVYLPVQKPDGGAGRLSRSRTVLGGQETILVAEDEEGVRELTQGLLQSLGYRVKAARDGREALEAFAANPHGFDLAVLDAIMPHLSGVKAYQAMSGIRRDLPVLFVSGYSPEMIGMPACGPRLRLLQKPFTRTELAHAVRDMLAEA